MRVNNANVDWLGSANGTTYRPHTYSPDHVYRRYVTGDGNPLSFRIADDPGAVGNLGSLEVQITAVGTSYTPINPTPTTELPNPSFAPSNPTPDSFMVFIGNDWESRGDVDPSKPTIVLSHGYNSGPQNWPKDMANTLQGVGANIVAWNWKDEAGNGSFVDLPLVAGVAITQGEALAKSLLETLGNNYDQPIHFIGHSLGARLNKTAADVVHANLPSNEGFLPGNTHMTLLDPADSYILDTIQLLVVRTLPYSDPIPTSDVAYIDNYITAFGDLHAEAVNVQLFAAQPDVNLGNISAYHSLPTEWYRRTIEDNLASDVGNRWSFESGGFDGAPGSPTNPDTYYYQDPSEGNIFELSVVPQLSEEAGHKQLERDLQWALSVVPFARQGAEWVNLIQGVRAVGTVTAGVAEDIVDGLLVQSLTFNLLSSSPAYAWATINVPNDAEYVTFDLLFEGLDEDDFFAFGIDDTLILSLGLLHLENGEMTNVGLLDVSQWAGSTVDFFYGLDTDEAGREVSIENFVFMAAIPEPSTFALLAMGALGLLVVARRKRSREH